MEKNNRNYEWLLEKYVSYFFIYSFIGWILEVIVVLFLEKRLVNRGFLMMPILPIYGFGAVLISIIFKNENYYWVNIALIGGFIATSLELVSSYILKDIFNLKLWDYSKMKYNFQGRISLITSLFFMIGSVLIVKILNPIFERKIRRYKYNIWFDFLLSVICIITFLDFVSTIVK